MRIVQISDLHLFKDKNQALLGVKTFESFIAVLDLIKTDKNPPDMMIISGDLSQDQSEASYQYLIDSLKSLTMPIYFVPGNHDNVPMLKRLFPCHSISDKKNIVFDNWNIILLNSQIPGEVGGQLDAGELHFMQEALKKNPKHHAIAFFHHQPMPVGSKWLDQYVLKNADEFWQIAGLYPQLKTLFFGHVHQVHEGARSGINYYSAPATCVQFKRNVDYFALENINPGYRWIELSNKGEIKTGVVTLPHYVGIFDEKATGYQ